MPFPTSNLGSHREYTQIQLIATGIRGQVYTARDPMGRTVAVKELLPISEYYEEQKRRFENERTIQSRLHHPHIITIYALEADPRTKEQYLICEYATGGSLAAYLATHGALSIALSLQIVLDICVALEATEAADIVHQDIKPSNIFLFTDQQRRIIRAKLGNFGIARDNKYKVSTDVHSGQRHQGTWQYMAPEQEDATREVDVRTDIYALGITLWELLTGEDYKVLRVQTGSLPILQYYRPDVSADLAMALERMIEADPDNRYQRPAFLARDVHDILAGRALMGRKTTHITPSIGSSPPPSTIYSPINIFPPKAVIPLQHITKIAISLIHAAFLGGSMVGLIVVVGLIITPYLPNHLSAALLLLSLSLSTLVGGIQYMMYKRRRVLYRTEHPLLQQIDHDITEIMDEQR